MALVDCVDCGRAISDSAAACIHCGRPLATKELPTALASSKPARPQLGIPSPTSKARVAFNIGITSLVATIGAMVALGKTGSVASFSGEAVGAALVPWALSLIALLRSERAAWITWATIFALSWLGQWSMQVDRQSETAAATEVRALGEVGKESILRQQALLDSVSKKSPSSPSQTTEPDARTSAGLESDGDALLIRRVTEVVREMAAKGSAMQSEVVEQVEALRLETVLDPAALTTPSGIAKSASTLTAYSDLLDRTELASYTFNREVERRVHEVVRGSGEEASFMSNFRSSSSKRIAMEEDLISNQRAVIQAGRAIVSFMSARVGTASVEKGQILFAEQAEADAYNALFAKLQSAVKEEGLLQSRYRAQLASSLKSFEEMSRSGQ